MKKALICYFSGTGNTKKVVLKAKESLENLGCEVELYNIDDDNFNYDLGEFDSLGLAFPIHAFNAPSNVLKFIKSLPKKKVNKKDRKSLFVIKTSGEPLALNNVSTYIIKAVLKKRGFTLTNEYHYCMPYNIIFRHTDNMAYKMWNTAERVIPIDCKEIVDGQRVKLKHIPFGRFMAWIFRIEHWGGRFNGKKYKVRDKCVQCQLCVKRCPTHNITIENGQFKFGKNCLMCMRCSFHCPKDAIKIGWFDKWKVNGAYNFNNPNEQEENRHKRYCKKSYIKYFARNEAKIAKFNENLAKNEENNKNSIIN